MRNFLAILRKDLHTLFISPIAYVVLFVFIGLTGFFFFIIFEGAILQAQRMALQSAQFGGGPVPVDVAGLIMRNYFGILSTFMLFVIPMITMGVFAEEKRRGTIELLFTSPLENWQLILGKFAAVMTVLVVMLLPSFIYLTILYVYSDPRPPVGPIFVGVAGAFLLGGALVALGLFISSMTENQIVAAVLTFGIFLTLWVLDAQAGAATSAVNEILKYLSVLNHYDDFTRGILDSQNVVFYLSFIALGLYLTGVSLDSVKWRQ